MNTKFHLWLKSRNLKFKVELYTLYRIFITLIKFNNFISGEFFNKIK